MAEIRLCGRPKDNGAPCGYRLYGARQCPWHGDGVTQADRTLHATKGAILSRLSRALPATTAEPPFDTEENIVGWSQRMAHAALTQDVDPRRLAEARGFAQLALSALSARNQAKLVDALLRLEHGGAAVALLAQFQAGQDRRRPLPGTRTA